MSERDEKPPVCGVRHPELPDLKCGAQGGHDGRHGSWINKGRRFYEWEVQPVRTATCGERLT